MIYIVMKVMLVACIETQSAVLKSIRLTVRDDMANSTVAASQPGRPVKTMRQTASGKAEQSM